MIDLDELARKATEADVHGDDIWRVYRCDWAGVDEACGIKASPFISRDDDACQNGVVHDTNRDECHHHMALADAEHIAANSPDVTLKLIARIRELEDCATDALGALRIKNLTHYEASIDEFVAVGRALVAKGIP